MVNCYCGCDGANRIKFAVSGTLYVIGMAMMLVSPQLLRDCYDRTATECSLIYLNGDEEDFKKYGCEEAMQRQNECFAEDSRASSSFALVFVGELLLVLATIPLCMMCCCTKKPQQATLLQAPTAVLQGDTYDRM